MPEAERTKQYFSLRKGLNTLSNEITFPDEYTSNEMNYTIEADGSRRRRKALDKESGGSTKTVTTIASGQVNQSFKWMNAGGNPAENLFVHQIGYTLYFSDDAETVSTTYQGDTVDLSTYVVNAATTAATVGSEPCSFAVHRGYLVVTNKHISPILVEFDGTDITSEFIQILHRDFEGIEDGVSVGKQPGGTITADHNYNLQNRGWTDTNITDYKTNSTATVNPAKNMIPWMGYKRTDATAGVYLADGDRAFDAVKMENEAFGNSSAPQGALFLNPLDTTTALTASGGAGDLILSYDSTDFAGSPSSNTTLTVTTSEAHGFTTSSPDIVVTGARWYYNLSGGGVGTWWGLINQFYGEGPWTPVNGAPTAAGEVQVNHADPNTLVFYISAIAGWSSWYQSTPNAAGVIAGEEPLAKSDGVALDVGPTVCESFAGRIWYAGIDSQDYADTIFFSRVSLKSESFGECYQKADPTDEFNNQLQSDDGGTIIIPNMGVVKQLKAARNSILVFATNGVWEISGGRSGFSATNYSVRKITDTGCTAPLSIVQVEDSTIYTGPQGVIALSPNQYTGLLEPTKMSEVIEPTWNAIPSADQQNVQTAYDDAKKRIYVLYRDNAYDTSYTSLAHGYNFALVYDMKNQGWYRLHFDDTATKAIISMFAITEADSSESNQKIKFQCQQSTTTVDTCDMNQTDYIDFTGSEAPLPFLVTGWDTSFGFQNRRQAPIIHVYNKRTGTGWTDAGGGDWSEDNAGSTLMAPLWDWTDSVEWDSYAAPTAQQDWTAQANNFGITGKIGKQVETYKHLRAFTPLAATDVDGYPIIATRHKVRGRGRSLSMRFDGAATKDSHLLGFTVNYRVSRRK